MKSQASFDEQYTIVRRLLLQKKFSIDTVRAWLSKHGQKLERELLDEHLKRMHRSSPVDRELEKLKHLEKKLNDGDEG